MTKKLYRRCIVAFVASLFIMFFSTELITATEHINEFDDVGEDSPHYEAIMSLSDQGIIDGYQDGTFRQWENISRQHAAVILYRILNFRTISDLDTVLDQFDDIDEESLYANEIAAVIHAGIFKGKDGKFLPNEPLTREQMASIINSAFDLMDYKVPENKDIYLGNVDESHKDSVQTMANLELTNLLSDYRPTENASRGAFTTSLYRTLLFLKSGKVEVN